MPRSNSARRLPRRRVAILLISVGVLLADSSAAGNASGVGVGGGADWYAGPGGERISTVLGFAAVGTRRVSLALGALRYDDNLLGAGNGALAVVGAPLGASAMLRVTGTRYIGDGDFRAWRVKAGPELRVGAERTLAIHYLHAEDNLGSHPRGIDAELGVPCSPGVTARFAGGAAALAGDAASLQGTIGLTWIPRARFEIAADAGLARNGAFASAPLANRGSHAGPLGLPLLGGSSGSALPDARATSSSRTEGVLSLGLRAYFP